MAHPHKHMSRPHIDKKKVLGRLRELVAALDRRVPQVESEGETRIARDAAALKRQAEKRIKELEAAIA